MHDAKQNQIQVKLLYCEYGLDEQAISDALDLPKSYIIELIAEKQYVQKQPLVSMVNTTPEVISTLQENPPLEDENTSMINSLQTKELQKQSFLHPLAAVAEITLMQKICQVARAVNTNDETAANTLASLTKSYKTLMQDTVASAKLMEQAKDDTGGININVQTYMG